jgi:hypothetical protein
MTLDEIYERVYEIRDLQDSENQHKLEDMLHIEVLTAIANKEVALCEAHIYATAALKTIEFDFPRWYA